LVILYNENSAPALSVACVMQPLPDILSAERGATDKLINSRLKAGELFLSIFYVIITH
jgi:hypothetical protein